MKPTSTMVIFSLILLSLCLTTHGSKDLMGTEIRIKTEEVKGEVWPLVTTKVLIKANPLASVAIFAAYDYQKDYVPNILDSKVVFEEVTKSNNTTHVKYLLDMPWPLGDSTYIHGHKLTSGPDFYKVQWFMVESESAENVSGYAEFKPHPANPAWTLMTYVSQVTPKSFFAGIFKKMMVKDVKHTLEVIRTTIEAAQEKKPELVKKYENKIKNVLAGEKAYL